MARLDELIFGYHRGRVEPSEAPTLTNVLLRHGICSVVDPDGSFTLRRRDKARFTVHARAKLRPKIGEVLGLYGLLQRGRRRYGLLAALGVLLAVFILTRGLVWDVRVSGNTELTEQEVIQTLSEHGLSVGSAWRGFDKNLVETALLSTHSEIAWISVNRRGTVAYVELIESENVGVPDEIVPLYSNVIADRDGVIEEITVKSGEAMVRAGDVVRAGDILISGVIESADGVRLCRAQGTVRAHSVTEISAVAPREVSERVPLKRRIAHLRVLIFNFSVNIFKNYGNCENSCDIIEETREFTLFNRCRLPISLVKTYVSEYSEQPRTRTDEEMIAEAGKELNGRLNSEFTSSDIIKLRTYGEFLSDGYRLTTTVVYSTDIGMESAIETS